tara:strand:+ start:424 stop:609 length:186 start_codon:yes stop_codon:yes gene_type:complete
MNKNIYKFIGAGFEISTIVFLCFFIGLKMDEKLQKNYCTIILSFLGILYALITLYKKVKKG